MFYISYVLFVIPKILDVYCLSWSLVISRSQFSLTTGSIFFLPISLILPSASGFVSCVHFVLPSAQFFVFFMVSLALQAISVLFCAPSCQHHCSLLVSSFLFSARELATATAFLSATSVSCSRAWRGPRSFTALSCPAPGIPIRLSGGERKSRF